MHVSLQKILYSVYLESKTCQKSPLSGSLPPIAVPATAHYVGEYWIGVEGLVGAGVQTELWVGATQGMYVVGDVVYTQLCSVCRCLCNMTVVYN